MAIFWKFSIYFYTDHPKIHFLLFFIKKFPQNLQKSAQIFYTAKIRPIYEVSARQFYDGQGLQKTAKFYKFGRQNGQMATLPSPISKLS